MRNKVSPGNKTFKHLADIPDLQNFEVNTTVEWFFCDDASGLLGGGQLLFQAEVEEVQQEVERRSKEGEKEDQECKEQKLRVVMFVVIFIYVAAFIIIVSEVSQVTALD